MRTFLSCVVAILVVTLVLGPLVPTSKRDAQAASHREAPLISQDPVADITDWFTFVSYDDPTKVTMIMNVVPLEDPSLGPNYFTFGEDVLYSFKVDYNRDAIEDVTFEVQFTTEVRAPDVIVALVGAGDGIPAPAGTAPPFSPGDPLVPPAITALDGPGSEGLNLRQSYSVTLVRGSGITATRTLLTPAGGGALFAVPSNVGPLTMPDYDQLAAQGIYDLGDGVRVFAGQRDDGFYIDLGATFDSLNFRATPVLSAGQDNDDTTNSFGIDMIAGFNVQSIAIEAPISMLTSTGMTPTSATDPTAVIGTWGTTARPLVTVRPTLGKPISFGSFKQVQRMGNPLINELVIGTGFKDMWGQDEPKNDSSYASFGLDPLLARLVDAVFGVPAPPPPRNDLADLLFQYPGNTPGPIADLLRLNVAVPPTDASARRRLGGLAADGAGYPNDRRVSDDVVDIVLRAVMGVLAEGFSPPAVGDGVNTNDRPYLETFPYQASPHSERGRVHANPSS